MKRNLLFILCIISMFGCEDSKQLVPVNLKCESEINPFNISRINPMFSWQFNDSSFGFMQSAYLVLVASDEKILNEKDADLWNSGKVISGQSNFIEYFGKALKPATRYFWTVKVWDNKERSSVFAQPAYFETGLLEIENWQAQWVKAPKELSNSSSVLFRKEFTIKGKVKNAMLYTTGLNAYNVYLNGEKIGDQYLAPGWTNFSKRIQYQVYDITSKLIEGNNAIGYIIAKFWNSTGDNALPSKLGIIMQLKVTYENNSTDWLYSGKDWKANHSPVVNCEFGKGEKYDSKLEHNGWNKVGFNDKKWFNADTEKNSMNLICQQLQPIVIHKELKPQKIIASTNSIIYDFGQTLPGWVKIKAEINAGQKVKINYLSTYNADENKPGNIAATDEYICNTNDIQEWEPLFAYHTFRYVEITGIKTNKDQLVARVAYPDIEQTGSFVCSNDLINNIYKNIVRSGRNNMVALLTGMPDSKSVKASPVSLNSFAATSLYTFDMNKAYNKYMGDLHNFQAGNGKIQIFMKNGANSPGWPEVIVSLPWETYLYTGDKRILTRNYKIMSAWHQSLMRESDAQAPPYMHDVDGIGDLFELDSTRVRPIGSCYYFYATTLMGKIEQALEKTEDATSFMELAGFTKDQFNQSYLKYRNARYWSATQSAHVLPLAVGLTPMSHGQRVADFIAANIKKRGVHPTTGVLTTRFLLPLLSEYNHHDLAYELMNQTNKPSWGYMVKKGSSTIWGNWEGYDDASIYQLALASAGEWLYGYLAGIRPDEKNPGFKHSYICPKPAGNLKWAEASLITSYGLLYVHWEKKEKTFDVSTEIPSNTWATVKLPVKNNKAAKIFNDGILIMQNGKATDSCPKSIKFRGFDSKTAVLEVGSGKYNFVVE